MHPRSGMTRSSTHEKKMNQPHHDFSTSWLTVAQAAKQLGISNTTCWRLIKAGKLPSIRVGWGWLITLTDVAAYKATLSL